MNRRFVGAVSLLAVSAVLVFVAGCTRPMSTGPIPTPQSAQSVTESPTPEAMSTVLATLAPGATATSGATSPEPTLPPVVEPTSTPIPVATAAPVPAATVAPSGSGTSHTVKSGEWLYSIARRYGVSPYTLAQVNGIGAP